MHSFPTHAPRQRYARQAPARGKGGAAWGKPCPRRQTLPPPGWRTSEHKAQHHLHRQPFPSDDGQHDRSTGRPRPQRPSANDDRTSARRSGGSRRRRRSRPYDESFSPTKVAHGREIPQTRIPALPATTEKLRRKIKHYPTALARRRVREVSSPRRRGVRRRDPPSPQEEKWNDEINRTPQKQPTWR